MNTIITLAVIGLLIVLIADMLVRRAQANKTQQRETDKDTQYMVLNTPDRATKLSPIINTALDRYDINGIRIPLDIIEDIQHQEFKTVEQCIATIEAHRTNWKFENQKRLPKG